MMNFVSSSRTHSEWINNIMWMEQERERERCCYYLQQSSITIRQLKKYWNKSRENSSLRAVITFDHLSTLASVVDVWFLAALPSSLPEPARKLIGQKREDKKFMVSAKKTTPKRIFIENRRETDEEVRVKQAPEICKYDDMIILVWER